VKKVIVLEENAESVIISNEAEKLKIPIIPLSTIWVCIG